MVIKLDCQKCSYVWTYRGKNPFWATCPHCLRKVNVEKQNEVQNENNSERLLGES